MQITKTKLYLLVAGLILTVIGGFIAFTPDLYLSQFTQSELISIDMKSEIRGMGGALFLLGFFILASAFKRRLEQTGLIVSAIVFSAFTAFRLVGIAVDGAPGQGIVVALAIEVVLMVSVVWLLLPLYKKTVLNVSSTQT